MGEKNDALIKSLLSDEDRVSEGYTTETKAVVFDGSIHKNGDCPNPFCWVTVDDEYEGLATVELHLTCDQAAAVVEFAKSLVSK